MGKEEKTPGRGKFSVSSRSTEEKFRFEDDRTSFFKTNWEKFTKFNGIKIGAYRNKRLIGG